LEKTKKLSELTSLRDYTAQYTGKGFEEYVRRLFTSRYETRAGTISFLLESDDGPSIKLRVARTNIVLDVPKRLWFILLERLLMS
jgi:hypothetical protein